jgi:hypothetical protein
VIVGPAGFVHEVTPAEPEMLNESVPPGVAAPVDPATVAVRISVPPRTGVPDALTDTEGAARFTIVEVVDATAGTALYATSPGKVKLAPYVPVREATTLQV